MAKTNKRVIKYIEKAFIAYRERNVKYVTFGELKDWINDNTKDGISSPRLSNFLRRRPQFERVLTMRKTGTNEVQSFWIIDKGEALLSDEIEATSANEEDCVIPKGWVEHVDEAIGG